jgi:CHASE2 domain-containing sensor protein
LETLIHILVAAPLALLVLAIAWRSPSAKTRRLGVAVSVAAFVGVFVGSYALFCTSCN